jgi:hypothetical protein
MDRTRQPTEEDDMILGWMDFVIIACIVAFLLDGNR